MNSENKDVGEIGAEQGFILLTDQRQRRVMVRASHIRSLTEERTSVDWSSPGVATNALVAIEGHKTLAVVETVNEVLGLLARLQEDSA